MEIVTVKGSDLRSGMVVDHEDCCGYSFKDTLLSVGKLNHKTTNTFKVHRCGLYNDEFPDGGEIDEIRLLYIDPDSDYQVLA